MEKRNGRRIARSYLRPLRLATEYMSFSDRVYVLTGHDQRSIWSAWSLLDGVAPLVPKGFAVPNEDTPKPKNYQNIQINVLKSLNEAIFHANDDNPLLKTLQSSAYKVSPYLNEAIKKQETLQHMNKLYKASGLASLDPKQSPIERISIGVPASESQIEVEKAIYMPILQNSDGIVITPEDESLNLTLTDEIKRIQYCGNNPEDQRTISRVATGILPTIIVKSFEDRIKGIDNKKKFVYYSAHDETIMPLLAHLGFNSYAIPRFVATVVFELHKIEQKWFVNLRYSSDPVSENFKHLSGYRTYMIPFGGNFVPMEKAAEGSMQFEDFRKEIVEVRNTFKTYDEWYKATRSDAVLDKKTNK